MRAVTLIAIALWAAPAAAQPGEPRRPSLPGGDTNSAQAYYDFGVRRLQADPQASAAAFYWASRLNPESADYVYARRVALMMTDPRRLLEYFRGERRVIHSREVIAIDSLLFRARMLDPFVHPRLDQYLWMEWIRVDFAQYFRESGAWADEGTMRQIVDIVSNDNPSLAASIANSRADFPRALRFWGRQARSEPQYAPWRVLRARAFFLAGLVDSARVEMQAALRIARGRDADSISFFYENKSAWEYSLGRIMERLGNAQAAREALERSLIEDLSYFPAHIQLGQLHVERGDTAAALREFRAAVESREHEYLPRVTYAFYLASTGQLDSARSHLQAAVGLEPWAAPPRLNLGAIMDAQGNAAGALEAFEAFLARAPRNDPDRTAIQARVSALRAARR